MGWETNCGFKSIDNEGEFYLRNCIEMTRLKVYGSDFCVNNENDGF